MKWNNIASDFGGKTSYLTWIQDTILKAKPAIYHVYNIGLWRQNQPSVMYIASDFGSKTSQLSCIQNHEFGGKTNYLTWIPHMTLDAKQTM